MMKNEVTKMTKRIGKREERNVSSDEDVGQGLNIRRRIHETLNGQKSDHPQADQNGRNNGNPRRYSDDSDNSEYQANTENPNLHNRMISLNNDVIAIRIQQDEEERYNEVQNPGMDYFEHDVPVRNDIIAPISEKNSSDDESSTYNTEESSYYSNSSDDDNEQNPPAVREGEGEEDSEGEERPRPFDLDLMSTPLFPGSNTTVGETMFLIETFSSRHHLNKVGFQDFLDVLTILIGPNALPKTMHLWDKQFLKIFSIIEYHLYCPNCCEYLVQIERRQKRKQNVFCEKCHTSTPKNLSQGNFFATFNLKKQIQAFLEEPEVYNALRENEQNRIQDQRDTCIRDVYDGIIYQNLKQPGNVLQNLNNLTFNFNLDGASFFTSSDTSCWPIQLSINELPFKLRSKKLILAGVWFGPKSPNIETFLKPFCDDMQVLANEGVSWSDLEGRTTLSKVIPLCCCVDSVARTKMMNANQFNGNFGCPWCYNPGRSVLAEGNTRAWKYLFLDEIYDERTETEVRQEMNEAEAERRIIKGFKGRSPFFSAPYFNVLWGFPPDYLHNVLLRVLLGTLFKLWFSTPGKAYYIGSPRCVAELDSNLRAIKPPDTIHRLPTSINKRSKWKASQGQSFLLHFGIPCLTGILPDLFLNHFALLVEGISLLLTFKISSNDLEKCESNLDRFVAEFEALYGEHNMTHNVHAISHLVKAVRMCGPLSTFSTFPYESGMLVLKQSTHSSHGVAIQISEKIAKNNSLSLLAREVNASDRVLTLAEKISSSHSLGKGKRVENECVVLGLEKMTKLKNEERILLEISGIEVEEEYVLNYKRIIVKGIKYASSAYTRSTARDNSFIELDDGSFGELSNIIVVNNRCLLFVKSLETEEIQYENVTLTQIRKILLRNEDRMRIVYPMNLAGTCVHMKINKQDCTQDRYLSKLPNALEVQ